jgi:phosphotransferase system  glucose/maltose/N-acetylglucosamine-specific IIC component
MLSIVSSVTSALILLLFLAVGSGIMKAVSGPILNNTEVYLILLLVLKIIQLQDKTLCTLSGLHHGKYSIFSFISLGYIDSNASLYHMSGSVGFNWNNFSQSNPVLELSTLGCSHNNTLHVLQRTRGPTPTNAGPNVQFIAIAI